MLKIKTLQTSITPEVTAMSCCHNCTLRNEFSDDIFTDYKNKNFEKEETSITSLKKNALLTAILIVGIKIDDACLKKGLLKLFKIL